MMDCPECTQVMTPIPVATPANFAACIRRERYRCEPCELTAKVEIVFEWDESPVSIRSLIMIEESTELDDWDEDEELGCVDLETRLDAALDRVFPRPRLCLTCRQPVSAHKGFTCPEEPT